MSKESKTYKNMPKKIYIRTFGCQMNVCDSENISGILRKEGYVLIDNPDEADIVLFNTCSVREHAEQRVWSNIGLVAEDKIIGVLGCMAQSYKEEIFKKFPRVDLVCGPGDFAIIPQLLRDVAGGGEHVLAVENLDKGLMDDSHPDYQTGPKPTYVKIMQGCNNFCSYCVVPYVRGRERSRPWQDVIKEVEGLTEKGAKEITLLGQNVNSYSGGISFVELLGKINTIEGIKKISFVTSHPKDAGKDLFYAMRDLKKVSSELHLPLQSGSNRILELMNRKYTREHYLELVRQFRAVVPKARISTDIIVGFPTEKEEDFRDTYLVLEEVCFNKAYIFKYSPRPHTAAEKMPDDVLSDDKKARHKTLLDLQKSISGKKRE